MSPTPHSCLIGWDKIAKADGRVVDKLVVQPELQVVFTKYMNTSSNKNFQNVIFPQTSSEHSHISIVPACGGEVVDGRDEHVESDSSQENKGALQLQMFCSFSVSSYHASMLIVSIAYLPNGFLSQPFIDIWFLCGEVFKVIVMLGKAQGSGGKIEDCVPIGFTQTRYRMVKIYHDNENSGELG